MLVTRPPEPVPTPAAVLGRGDTSRRWGLRSADGEVHHAGLTRPEAQRAAATWPADRESARARLVRVELDVLLTEGAGPYLVDGDGTLMLVLAPHPDLNGLHMALGAADAARDRVGLVRSDAAGGWSWACWAETAASSRVAVLDDLVALATGDDLDGWCGRHHGVRYGDGLP